MEDLIKLNQNMVELYFLLKMIKINQSFVEL
ncbi:hypothetical protein HAL1_06680 [Halomonas sp. HAL1]|nr:hypothetical protein HAL1_06680 [Halomonas sp. HAL1]